MFKNVVLSSGHMSGMGSKLADVALAHFEYRQANVTEAQSKAVAGYCRKKGETPGCAFLSFYSDVCAGLPLDNVRMNSNIVTKDSSWHCLQTILSAATSGKPKGLPCVRGLLLASPKHAALHPFRGDCPGVAMSPYEVVGFCEEIYLKRPYKDTGRLLLHLIGKAHYKRAITALKNRNGKLESGTARKGQTKYEVVEKLGHQVYKQEEVSRARKGDRFRTVVSRVLGQFRQASSSHQCCEPDLRARFLGDESPKSNSFSCSCC